MINLKPLVKKIPTLCEDRDKTVREETKKLIIELYRWISSALKPQLSGLKPVMVINFSIFGFRLMSVWIINSKLFLFLQLQELDAEFEKVASEKPSPTRLLRSQQAKAEQIAHGGGDEEEGNYVFSDTAHSSNFQTSLQER